MFVDAAAIVAMLSQEAEAPRCSQAIMEAPAPFTSAIAVWEASMALSRSEKLAVPVEVSLRIVSRFLEERAIALRELPPASEATSLSIEAASRFRNNAIRLNLADCFHYACARYYAVSILSTADEFRLTDLETVP
ncbi:type II toxin-antitoxin system VapC family toxin [Mesorhizobium sp. B2-5-4]|uniref:type II toxin-antitoxin system VapC family toxin n=1 Tax=unclassified Mesorhizobium TaxID=325217 RepID=UPI00112EE200|nr:MULTISPECIES: type II toxin-antitoxin system VapC family toxin [unclassified Mesorhizobium]TPJ44861.1 type II toxin-antitoxin system VapC family toxin [Mesorhizobium sp. B2-6-5]TPJ91771.1 type II toxin-antitoxin system VapC family toxin [Mesorhizobium sp. B2-5-13]TPK48936.1 type II toxin-antitoxin system VapC family toxin [Mesorhizobium sp. B2-5-4]TPK53098.1 type II toxin-antitoxin system VapC family toxin [Mesorhizobium sp. B2-5-5]TPL78548.1 type II toxin-antitoxin system VapC family toxin